MPILASPRRETFEDRVEIGNGAGFEFDRRDCGRDVVRVPRSGRSHPVPHGTSVHHRLVIRDS